MPKIRLRHIKKTIALNPAYIKAYINLGAILAKRGEYDKARAVWEEGLKIEADNFYIAQNLERLKRFQCVKGG